MGKTIYQEKYQNQKENYAKSHRKYMENFCEIKVRMTKERRAEIQEYCRERDLSVTAFVNELIDREVPKTDKGE